MEIGNMTLKYAYMMIGIPGCGKSTWIKENVFNSNTVILSTDNIIEKVAEARDLTYNEVFEELISDATKMFFHDISDNVLCGVDIIIDRTNLSKKSRKKILDMIPDDYIKVAIVVTCSDEFILANRLQNRPGKNIPNHVIENMKKSFEIPSEDEGFKSIVHIETAPQIEGE
jgi:predicted kinase